MGISENVSIVALSAGIGILSELLVVPRSDEPEHGTPDVGYRASFEVHDVVG